MPDSSYLEWPFLDESHRALKAELDQWCEANSTALEQEHVDLDATCRGLVKLLGKGGWLTYTVPDTTADADQQLDQQLDVRSLCLLRETLAYHSGLADFCFAMQGLGSGPISFFGTPELKAEYLPGVASGDTIAAFALSEKKAGSDVSAMATRAERDGDHYVLNGEKTWISNAGIADFYTVFAPPIRPVSPSANVLTSLRHIRWEHWRLKIAGFLPARCWESQRNGSRLRWQHWMCSVPRLPLPHWVSRGVPVMRPWRMC